MPTSRSTSSMLNPRAWLLCAVAVSLAGGCNDSSGLSPHRDAAVDAKRDIDAKTGTDAGRTCEQAGGSCVAVYPGTCASGTVVDLSCGSGVGTECCMPGGNGGSVGSGGSAGSGGSGGSGGSHSSGGEAGTGGASGAGGRTGGACEQAGGSCVAVYPGACASGTVVAISCGPGVGTECCMAGGNGGATGSGGAHESGGASGTGGTHSGGGASGTGGAHSSGGASGTGGQPGTTCQQAGGSCVAVIPGACPSGLVVGLSCGAGVGTECCMPGSRDAGIDSGTQDLAELCTATGGTVTTQLCCSSVSDFPQTCLAGACSCGPSSSKTIKFCSCGADCFSHSVGCTAR